VENQRVTIAETRTGLIELVLVKGAFTVLQFNCECVDALPYCKANCCRARSGLNVVLQPDEVGKFQSRLIKSSGLHVLPGTAQTDACVYLSEENKCNVHTDKPKMCGAWHCSPGGKGEGIQVRDGGWFLSPLSSGL
jgi:hypothetical protein